jgi:hypothetical protein
LLRLRAARDAKLGGLRMVETISAKSSIIETVTMMGYIAIQLLSAH